MGEPFFSRISKEYELFQCARPPPPLEEEEAEAWDAEAEEADDACEEAPPPEYASPPLRPELRGAGGGAIERDGGAVERPGAGELAARMTVPDGGLFPVT